MQRSAIPCEKCGTPISKSNYNRHLQSCSGIPKSKLEKCPYCGIDLSNKNAGGHIAWCKENPDLDLQKRFMDLKNARFSITRESRKKINKSISKAHKSGKYSHIDHGEFWRGRSHSVESRKLMRAKRIKFLEDNPELHPWKKSDKFRSAPCEYFKEKLRSSGIDFEEEYMPLYPKRYFSIDIAFPEIQLGIEINGEQHYNRDGSLKGYYQKRHNEIEKAGWDILELHYKEAYNENWIEEIINLIK